MRQIDIDVDVFALIWANRKAPEANENEILNRILRSLDHQPAPETASNRSSENPEDPNHRESFELEISKDSSKLEAKMLVITGKIRWVDDVKLALHQLGGVSSLHRIYQKVEEIRRTGGRSTPKSLDATVRQTIESFSSDSDNYRGEDLFKRVSRGEWALRDWAKKSLS